MNIIFYNTREALEQFLINNNAEIQSKSYNQVIAKIDDELYYCYRGLESSRGRRAQCGLIDEEIPYYIVTNVLMPFCKDYRIINLRSAKL